MQQKGKSAWPPVMPGRTNIEVHAQGLHYPQGQSELAGLLAVLQVDDKPHTNIGNQCQVWLGQLQSLAELPVFVGDRDIWQKALPQTSMKWEQPAATHAATANTRHLNVFYGKAARLSARIVPEPLMTRYGKGRAA